MMFKFRRILYCCFWGILKDESSVVRKEKFRELLEGKTKKLESALKRLETIVIRVETTPNNTPVGSISNPISYVEDFVDQHPEWKIDEDKEWKGNSFVVFRDQHKLKGKSHALVERFQKSGLCYMHAPVVLQHYLAAMANDKSVPMLDMIQYLKQRMPSTKLYNHIFGKIVGDSFDFLEKILFDKLKANDIIEYPPSQLEKANLCEQLINYGPALVSGFKVSEIFKDTNQWYHTGNQSDEFLGMHAMILIGYR